MLKDPDSPELKKKYESAKREAIVDAHRRARGCVDRQQWKCAVNEADFGLTLDPANEELSDVRAEALRLWALAQLDGAKGALRERRYGDALEALDKAIRTARLPEVESGVAEVRQSVATQAVAEMEPLRSSRQFLSALALLDLAVRADPRHAALRETVLGEFEAFRSAEYERLASLGDLELGQSHWREAAARYREALAAKPGGRAETLAQYAGGMAQGESGITQRSFEWAASGYRQAMASGHDTRGLALSGLASVEVRPYRMRIRELMVSPARPDGRPWVGPRSPLVDRLVKSAAVAAGSYFLPGVGGILAGAVVGEMQALPPENTPTVHVQVVPPSGPQLMTIPAKRLYMVLESEFVVAANHFDERTVALRVIGEGDAVQDVGVFDLKLGDVVRNGGFVGADHSVLGLKLLVEPATDGPGHFSTMRPVQDPTNGSSGFSEPKSGSLVYRITKIGGSIAGADYENEFGMDGPPDFFLALDQNGQTIFSSATVQDTSNGEWLPSNVFLYAVPGDRFALRTWDIDIQDDDSVLVGEFSAEALAAGEVTFQTRGGSWVRLFVERVR